MDLAHGIGSGADLPISAGAASIGGAAAVLISLAVLAVAWREPRFERLDGRALPRLTRLVDAPATRLTLRGLGVSLFSFTVWCALAGRDDPGSNPAFGIVFVLLWVGLVPASLLLGPIVRALSPLRAVHAGVVRAVGRRPEVGLVALPRWIGCWPAATTLLAFTWVELVSPQSTTLLGLRSLLICYVVVLLLGAFVFGDDWFERADPFEVYSTLTATLSPWARGTDGALRLVNPMRNLASAQPPPGLVAVIAVLLGSTAFDSFAGSTRWLRFTQSTSLDVVLLETGLLAGTVVAVGLVFVAVTEVPARVTRAGRWTVPHRMAHSLLPIVLGYVVAHYLTLFVETGQLTFIQTSDPLDRGWDLLGIADRQVNLWLSLHPTFLATVKVAAIVAGHLLAAVAAHDRALQDFPPRRRIAAQAPLLAVMVAYTFGGLVLLLGV